MLSYEIVQQKLSTDPARAFSLNRLPLFFRMVAVALGGLHTWAAMTRHSMNADGISYLDIGDAYMRGDWQMAINSVWSPLYSWILGPVIYYLKPSMPWEFPLVQLVNLAIYLAALTCFDYFWRGLRSYHRSHISGSANSLAGLPEWMWVSLGYGLFIWSSLNLIEIWAVTPDMLMAGLVYLAAGLLARIRCGNTTWPVFVSLGVVLGLGFLAKAIMFPLAFVILLFTFFMAGNLKQALVKTLAALFIFLLVSGPFIALISAARGEFTFSDAGKVTYVRHVAGLSHPHWQGPASGPGAPEHPSRRVFNAPPVYEFGQPIGGTYPIAYDPYYWVKGAAAAFSLEKQAITMIASGLFYFDLFFRQEGVVLAGVFVLYLLGFRRPASAVDLVRKYGLALLAVVAFGMYGLVLVEGRYIGVFVVLFWGDLLANTRPAEIGLAQKLTAFLGAAMIVFMLATIAAFNLEGLFILAGHTRATGSASGATPPPAWPGEVAEELHRLGVQPGDRVGVIGYAFDSFWARLARVKIVAELVDVDADPFWVGDPALQAGVIRAFAGAGARAIVAEHVPGYARLAGWRQVGNSNFYIHLIQ